jgi:chromosome segregation ATPase
VDYFSPGLRELSRKCGRQIDRLRLVAERRKLDRAETELGLLGWQQADYDRETQREVEKIQNYEREQSRLTNESAEIGRVVGECQARREAARKEFESLRKQFQAERHVIAEPLDRIEKQLVGLRKQEPAYERRIPELDRELRLVNESYTQLLTSEVQSAQLRDDLIRLRERTVAIPNEKADLRTQHLRIVSEIKMLETRLARAQTTMATLDKQAHELEAQFAEADREILAEIRAHQREKARVEKEIDALERAKANPYQQIGRVLADNDLAPMNQPNALEKVRRHRTAMHDLRLRIQESFAVSRAIDPTLVRTSYLLWASLLAALLLIAGMMLTTGARG